METEIEIYLNGVNKTFSPGMSEKTNYLISGLYKNNLKEVMKVSEASNGGDSMNMVHDS